MTIIEFSSEDEMDNHLEMIEDINYQYANLKKEIEEKKKDLEDSEKELVEFLEDNKDYIIRDF